MAPQLGTIAHLRSGSASESGSTLLAVVTDYVSLNWTERVGGDRGVCTMQMRVDDPHIAHAAIFNVIRIIDVDVDGTQAVYEYRIVELRDGPHSATVEITAMDLSHDIGRVRLTVTTGGTEMTVMGSVTGTPDYFIDTYVLPALAAVGMTNVVKGTITPTGVVTIDVSTQTPGSLMARLESETKYEWWLERNGDTNYKIMLGRRTAAGTPQATVGSNVERLERQVIVDERFYNRAVAQGATLDGEVEPTHLGQHGWRVSNVSGDNLTLAHPIAGGAGPLGCDDQLNTLSARVGFPTVMFPDVDYDPRPCGIAYDYTRRIVWAVLGDPNVRTTKKLYWYDLRDGTCGKVAIAGTNTIGNIVYVPARDELWVACYDTNKVERISANTKASVGNLACAGGPSTLTVLGGMGIAQVAVGFGTAAIGVELWNTATLALDATLAATTPTNASVIYDSGSTRYFVFAPTVANVQYYSAAYASLGGIATGLAGGCCQAGINAGVMYVAGNTEMRSITCSTAALGTLTVMGNYDGVAFGGGCTTGQPYAGSPAPTIIPYVGSRLYVHARGGAGSPYRSYILTIDPASSYAITGGQMAAFAATGGLSVYDPTDDIFVVATEHGGAEILYRNGLTSPRGRLQFTIQDSVLSTQVVVKPSATKGPIYAEMKLEVRTNAADTYLRAITDPVSIATYSQVDGFPRFSDTYKRNYVEDARIERWASSRPVHLGLSPLAITSPSPWPSSVGEPKWYKSRAQATARTTTGQIDGDHTVGASGAITLNLKGLAASRWVQVGDAIRINSTYTVWVLTSAQANGSGVVAVSVYCPVTGAPVFLNNQSVSIHSPAQTDATGDYMLVLPGGPYPAGLRGGTYLPRISSATGAWLRVRLFAIQSNLDLNTFSMVIRGYKNVATIAPASSVSGSATTPTFIAVALEQQLSLTAPEGDDFIRFTVAPNNAMGGSDFIVWYVDSIEAYIAGSAECPTPTGARNGDELTPWTGSNQLLFTYARSTPTTNYKLQMVEQPYVDGSGAPSPAAIGKSVRLWDPARGIATSTPRIVEISRTAARFGDQKRVPNLVLSNRDQYLVDNIVALEQG